MDPPDFPDRGLAHANGLRHRGPTPVRRVRGLLFQCLLDDPGSLPATDRGNPSASRRILFDPSQALFPIQHSGDILVTFEMPHKFNAARRHKFDKAQYRVINWAEYNESLRQRGDLTIWVSDEAQSVWSAPRRTSRGGQRRYSDLAIETCLTLRTAYRLGLRQTQGLMGSIGTLMGLDIRVPDYSTLSRRANGLSIAQAVRQAGSVPVHLVVDSTGLKIFGEGEWLAQKHKTRGIRRRWRKLGLGLDLASGAIFAPI